MSEEEIAEEWIKEHPGLIGSYKFVKYDFDSLKQVFLAGLKVGKPKWHDLRKDPNDLPKKDCEVVNLHENGNKTIQKWKNGYWTNAIVIPVIAWHEIPQFKE